MIGVCLFFYLENSVRVMKSYFSISQETELNVLIFWCILFWCGHFRSIWSCFGYNWSSSINCPLTNLEFSMIRRWESAATLHFIQGRRSHSSVFVYYLIYVWVPVFIVLGLGCCAVDSGEEGGLGEVYHGWIQIKRLGNNCLDSLTDISNGKKTDTTCQIQRFCLIT